MEHCPYPKIPARADGSRPAPGGQWTATEKIHGAQLVIVTDGAAVRFGKRKAWLAHDEPFFGWQLLRAELDAAARAIQRALAPQGIVRLYGEIFGGAYPHPAVPVVPGVSPVQTGIWYAPCVCFALFDVAIEPNPVGVAEFVSQTEMQALGSAHGLLLAPLLGRGPRAELEALPVRFPTRVPALLGLPPIADNMAEGFVLKPDVRENVDGRYVTKWKIPELDEARFDESAPWDPDAPLALDGLRAIAERMVNPARVSSARSKVGTHTAAVCEEVVLDVLVDLEGAYPGAMRDLRADEEETLRAWITETLTRLR